MSGQRFEDPNREAVGVDPAWVEGTGGTPVEPEPQQDESADEGEGADEGEAAVSGSDLETLTKAELLELAKSQGVSPANNDMTKAELIAGIEAAR